MPAGETRASVSGWTTDTLHAHVQAVIDERDRRYEQRFAALSESNEQRFRAQAESTKQAIMNAAVAVTKAETAIERRLENTNEWRQAMNDRDLKLLPRAEYDRAHLDLVARVEEMKQSLDDKIVAATTRITGFESRSLGIHAGWGYLVGVVGLASGIIAIIYTVSK